MESCLSAYTKTDILTDYQCRKCTLLSTLDSLTHELDTLVEKNKEKTDGMVVLESQMERLKYALQNNMEANLVRYNGLLLSYCTN